MARAAFYSHDTFGLGHLRRSLKLAAALAEKLGVLEGMLITGSAWAHLFRMPPGFATLRIPPVVKEGVGRYRPRAPGPSLDQVLAERRLRISSALARFEPDLMVVDNVPCGLHGEVLPALRDLKSRGRARLVLALRDILDRGETIRAEWAASGAPEALSSLYDEIWVFGLPEVLDPRRAYGMDAAVARKVIFCGYLDGRPDLARALHERRPGRGAAWIPAADAADRPLVLVTGGGGGDARALVVTYLRMLRESRPDVRSLIVLGPDFPGLEAGWLDGLNGVSLDIEPFVADLPALLRGADLVISMAGYNTVCEILAARRRAVLVPRVWPRQEQRLRARALAGRHGVVVLEPARLSPETLRQAMNRALAEPEPEPVRLTGGTVAAVRAASLLASRNA